jgi:hypothetical protein
MAVVKNLRKDLVLAGVACLPRKGVTALVAEGFGPRIVEHMQGKGIRPIAFTGLAEEAVRSLVRTRQASTIREVRS